MTPAISWPVAAVLCVALLVIGTLYGLGHTDAAAAAGVIAVLVHAFLPPAVSADQRGGNALSKGSTP